MNTIQHSAINAISGALTGTISNLHPKTDPAMSAIDDLFLSGDTLEPIPMCDAEVFYQSRFDLGESPDSLMQTFIAEVPWRAEKIAVWGKIYGQPRLMAWYGDPASVYTYSGLQLIPLPWTARLLDLKKRVEAVAGTTFNSVLLNYYRDHRDSMGFHSDDEKELGTRPAIASLSIGAERTFIFKHKTSKVAKAVRLKLGSGSLLLMKGATQKSWKHGIDKQSSPCGPRINLTFRSILSLK